MPQEAPTSPGYYWAKLKTPSCGRIYVKGKEIEVPAEQDWVSGKWEIVEVWDNHSDDPDEQFGVSVPGIYPTQWVGDFFWGPRVADQPPEDTA